MHFLSTLIGPVKAYLHEHLQGLSAKLSVLIGMGTGFVAQGLTSGVGQVVLGALALIVSTFVSAYATQVAKDWAAGMPWGKAVADAERVAAEKTREIIAEEMAKIRAKAMPPE